VFVLIIAVQLDDILVSRVEIDDNFLENELFVLRLSFSFELLVFQVDHFHGEIRVVTFVVNEFDCAESTIANMLDYG
jgi:hypothetical protein